MRDGQIEQTAILLRVGSRRAGISSTESWNEIGEHRRARWRALAQGLYDEGLLLVEKEDLIRLRALARHQSGDFTSSDLERTVEVIDGLLGNGSASDDVSEEEGDYE